MMAGTDDDSDKSHEPTQNKLDEARKKGEIARSADLLTAASYTGFLLAILSTGQNLVKNTGGRLMSFFETPQNIIRMFFHESGMRVGVGVTSVFSPELFLWLLTPGLAVLLAAIAQRSLIFTPEKLKPQLERLNPVKNAQQKYGSSGLFEFTKSFAKLIIFSALLVFYLVYRFPQLANAIHGSPGVIGVWMTRLVTEFLFVVIAVSLTIGGVDYLWQRFDHLRRNRMSHREVKEEHKQHEGDPHFKQERMNRAAQIATGPIAVAVPKADVVIVNPTHFAVVLQWSRLPGSAPECTAKGQDHVALRIREIAAEHGVPVCHDPPTARALYASTEVGREIDPRYYRAVAAAIRFAQNLNERARAFR